MCTQTLFRTWREPARFRRAVRKPVEPDALSSDMVPDRPGRRDDLYPSPRCCTGEDCIRRGNRRHAIVTALRTDGYFHMFEVTSRKADTSCASSLVQGRHVQPGRSCDSLELQAGAHGGGTPLKTIIDSLYETALQFVVDHDVLSGSHSSAVVAAPTEPHVCFIQKLACSLLASNLAVPLVVLAVRGELEPATVAAVEALATICYAEPVFFENVSSRR